MTYSFTPIGVVRSCFKEKFGIPRQSGLVPSARASIEINAEFARDEAFLGLTEFSHIWLVFVFHVSLREQWKPTVRPPRLGGNQRLGVFATRSPFRPNPIGLSAVQLHGVSRQQNVISLEISGADLLDGTPILDIKPYIPYADSIADASGGFAPTAPLPTATIRFSDEAEKFLATYHSRDGSDLKSLICEILRQDPRPAYQKDSSSEREYAMHLQELNVRWQITNKHAYVIAIEPVNP